MIRSITEKLAAAVLVLMVLAVTAQAATLSPTLESALATQPLNTDAGLVIISFNTTNGLNESHLNTLRGLGITQGFTFQNLGMVAVPATLAQVKSLSTNQSVRSVWSNDRLEYFMEQARMLAGVQRVLTDASFTYANGGLPVSGKGDFSVMVIDSGIDATHNDLKFGDKVVQNVQVITSTQMSTVNSRRSSPSRTCRTRTRAWATAHTARASSAARDRIAAVVTRALRRARKS